MIDRKSEAIEKNRKLNELLDSLEFNQSVARANELDKLLVSCNFLSIGIRSGLTQKECRYTVFKAFEKRMRVEATDIFGRGINVEQVNINELQLLASYYLHQVG
ncbi:hypothetical protein B0H19DRAFT_1372629 [Mycena capillaripes]|nr:hypothetical protein B0H19DRAFT_1372629 [Mycena capillaripes]